MPPFHRRHRIVKEIAKVRPLMSNGILPRSLPWGECLESREHLAGAGGSVASCGPGGWEGWMTAAWDSEVALLFPQASSATGPLMTMPAGQMGPQVPS